MKIVFMGTPEFARSPLACLDESAHEIVGVVTGPDERSPRGATMVPTPVKREAARRGLSVLTPEKLKSKALREALAVLEPDVFVVVAFKILPRRLFTLPRFGSMNIHASLLPKYRGAAPINWALINGEPETGLSSFVLNEKVDTGDLILQERVPISEQDNFDSLYARLSDLAGPFALRSLDRLADPDFTPVSQDATLATPAPKLTPADAMIDWGFPARHVRNFVRGLATTPGAYTFFRGQKVKVLECRIADEAPLHPDVPPGTILPVRKGLLVQCAGSVVEVTGILPEGKKLMDGLSFRNGFRPEQGERFGEIPQELQEKP